MKYEVINRFRCKNTGAHYRPGHIFESDDQARIAELRSRRKISPKPIAESEPEPKEEPTQKESLSEKTYNELRAMARESGIEEYGKMNKDQLIEALENESS